MNRKPTKTTRGPNAAERKFQAWLKEQPCCVTGREGPSIVHHCEGSTFKNNKVLVGHWFCIPLCEEVDSVITLGSRRKFRDLYGPQCDLWKDVLHNYEMSKAETVCPYGVHEAIMDWGR